MPIQTPERSVRVTGPRDGRALKAHLADFDAHLAGLSLTFYPDRVTETESETIFEGHLGPRAKSRRRLKRLARKEREARRQ